MTATFWDRAAAWGYDFFSFQLAYTLVSFTLPDNFFVSFVFFLVFLGLYFFYNAHFESKYGTTLGKFAVGIAVVDGNNKELSFAKSLERQLVACLSWATLNIGHVMGLYRSDKKMLHDMLSGTKVVKKEVDISFMPYLSPAQNQKLKILSFAMQALVVLTTTYFATVKMMHMMDTIYQNAAGV